MLNEKEFERHFHIDNERLRFWLDSGWISPLIVDGKPVFREVDSARAALILDLSDDMGINDAGVEVVLGMVDQLYSLRRAFNSLVDALEVQPRGIRRHIAKDAQRLDRLNRMRELRSARRWSS